MSRVLWKIELFAGRVPVALDDAVSFVSAGLDGYGQPCAWYETDPVSERRIVERPLAWIEVIATGDPVPEGYRHLGTFVPEPGLVFHAYVPEGT